MKRNILSEKMGIAVLKILELVKPSYLTRITRVKGIRSRLYFEAGLETSERLVQCDPESYQLSIMGKSTLGWPFFSLSSV